MFWDQKTLFKLKMSLCKESNLKKIVNINHYNNLLLFGIQELEFSKTVIFTEQDDVVFDNDLSDVDPNWIVSIFRTERVPYQLIVWCLITAQKILWCRICQNLFHVSLKAPGINISLQVQGLKSTSMSLNNQIIHDEKIQWLYHFVSHYSTLIRFNTISQSFFITSRILSNELRWSHGGNT